MQKTLLVVAALLATFQIVPVRAAAQQYVDYTFLAECAAIYSVKAEETMGKVPPDYTDNYYSVAAAFYEKAVGGGEDMKAVYKSKISEFKNAAANDAVTKQYKRALEKQCAAVAPDHGIRIK